MKPGRAGRAFLITLLALVAVSCTESLPAEFPVPEFSLTSPNTGMVADNSMIEGHPTMLYWFTSW